MELGEKRKGKKGCAELIGIIFERTGSNSDCDQRCGEEL